MTINCVSPAKRCRYFAKRSTFASSNAASISSSKQNGIGLNFNIENNIAIAVKEFSPPLSSDRFPPRALPGGSAIISTPAVSTSSSVSTSFALPPPNNSLNVREKFSLIF